MCLDLWLWCVCVLLLCKSVWWCWRCVVCVLLCRWNVMVWLLLVWLWILDVVSWCLCDVWCCCLVVRWCCLRVGIWIWICWFRIRRWCFVWMIIIWMIGKDVRIVVWWCWILRSKILVCCDGSDVRRNARRSRVIYNARDAIGTRSRWMIDDECVWMFMWWCRFDVWIS